jgi:hypothetical protein
MPLHKIERKKKRSIYWQENRLLIILKVMNCATEGGANVTSICFGMAEMLRGNYFRNVVILGGSYPECNTSWKIVLLEKKNFHDMCLGK